MMGRFYSEFLGGARGVALLILRLVFGIGIAIHGWPKIQNPTGWMGDAPIPGALQAVAAVSEFGGGICWALGALTPLASLGLIGTMGFATFMVHIRMGHTFVSNKHPIPDPSFESAAGYLVVAILLLLVGPGRLSVDWLLFGRRPANDLLLGTSPRDQATGTATAVKIR